MSYSNRIYMYGPVGLLLLIAILYSVFWRVEADTMSARLDRANGGEIAPGISFSFAQKSVGGFPFRLDVLLTGVRLGYRNGNTQIDWRTDRFALHRMAYGRNQFIFESDGTQTISWATQPDAMPATVLLTPETARASAILNQGRLLRFDLDLWRPHGTKSGPSAMAAVFAADRAQFHALARRNNTLDVAIQVDNGKAGPSAPQAVQASLPLIDGRVTLNRADLLTGLEQGNEDIARALELWSNRMGVANVTSLALNWPDAHAVLRGELKLDANNQLSGTLHGDQTADRGGSRPIQLDFRNGSMTLENASAAGPAATR
jgi:hypothetical protein